jgi:hypothetical protein
MIAVETVDAIIDFGDILKATEVVNDPYTNETPWDNCDGFEHTATPRHRYNDAADTRSMRGCIYCDGRRETVVITLPEKDPYGIYNYQRSHGASRQVAREAEAASRRITLDLLVNWYGNGWEWYGVVCEYEILGETYEASIWGVDDHKYADTMREEIAGEVACQLRKAGYTVDNMPANSTTSWTRQDKINRLKHNLNSQNWS